MGVLKKIKDKLDVVGFDLVKKFKKELKEQGHNASSKLHDSIKHRLSFKGEDAFIEITSKTNYAQKVNKGQKPHAPNLDNILDWIEDRKKTIPYSSEQEKHEIAYAIIRSINQQGTPTAEAFSWTQNGRRIGYMDFVIQNNKRKIKRELVKEFGKIIRTEFRNVNKK